MSSKVITNRRHLTFPIQVNLEVQEILDSLRRVDYDYLMDELEARKLVEPSDVSASRRQITSLVEQDYLQALDKLKTKFLSVRTEDINFIISLAKKL